MNADTTLPQAYYALSRNKMANQLARQFRPKRDAAFVSQSHAEFWKEIEQMGAALIKLGVKRKDKVAILADNCPEWLVIDFAVLSLGALDVPRGTDTTDNDITFILNHVETKIVFVENARTKERVCSLKGQLPYLDTLVCIENSVVDTPKQENGLTLYNWQDLTSLGAKCLKEDPYCVKRELQLGKRSDPATIIYTSGTTGEPKGVELTHQSFLFQVERIGNLLPIKSYHKSLNALPVWHAFERSVEYILLLQGGCLAYSKLVPTILLKDIGEVNPHYLSFVPRIWENIRNGVFKKIQDSSWLKRKIFSFFYQNGKLFRHLEAILYDRYPAYEFNSHTWSKFLKKVGIFLPYCLLMIPNFLADILVFSSVRKKLGKNFICGISGGGALPSSVENFYRIMNLKVIEGYGLTELGPIINVNDYYRNIYDTVGPFLKDVKFKIVNEEGRSLKAGEKGELWIKSPQIMLGYYKRPDLTEQAITADGWFKTGDLVCRTIDNRISIVGRLKDTIILRSGKNIEPELIEKALIESPFIESAVLVGQDKEYLGALIVPNFEYLNKHLRIEKKELAAPEILVKELEVKNFYKDIVHTLLSAKNRFKPYERVVEFALLPKSFEVNRELTPSLKVKRSAITQLYAKEIESLFEEVGEIL